jgi:hypothetical protein
MVVNAITLPLGPDTVWIICGWRQQCDSVALLGTQIFRFDSVYARQVNSRLHQYGIAIMKSH